MIRLSNGGRMDGLAEPGTIDAAKRGEVVQFERVGYCKLRMNDIIHGNYTHD
jgi:hypothetical protein